MKSTILSLTVSVPKQIEWKEKSINSSMQKIPVEQLIISKTQVQGDVFGNAEVHGTEWSIVYIIAKTMGNAYFKKLGLPSEYSFGRIGENICVDEFDESQIFVGDLFQIGDVLLEATFTRMPCHKLNVTFERPDAQNAMIDLQRAGVYFRVLKPGTIKKSDSVIRIKQVENSMSIQDVFLLFSKKIPATAEHLQRLQDNPAFPEKFLKKLQTMVSAPSP